MKIYLSVAFKDSKELKKLMLFLQEQGHEVFRAPYVFSDNPESLFKNNVDERKEHIKWVDGCDVLIADISEPSEGRAMMIQRAVDMGKKIVFIKKGNREIGHVFQGLVDEVGCLEYENIEKVVEKLDL